VTVYDTGGTPWSHGLPAWATGVRPESRVQELAVDTGWRERVVDHLRREAEGWVIDWDRLTVSKVNELAHRGVLGRTIREIADADGLAPEVAVVDLLAADGHFWVSPPNKSWRDVLDLLSHDRCIPMADGITVDPRRDDRLVGLDRSWNTFRRFLASAVPEAPISLETGLRKLTADAADRLGLSGRGVIEAGAAADFVVVRPKSVSELQAPQFDMAGRGIEAVMVNGHWAYRSETGFASRGAGLVL
jgi:N-acyl-D-amino-acid deacylase